MLIPTHCQTCGEPIGHLWEIYVELVQKYASEDKKLPEGKKPETTPEYRARQDLIEKHDLDGRRQCCLYAHIVNYDATDLIS